MSTDTIKSVTFPNIVTGTLRIDPDGKDTTEFGVYSTGTVQQYELGTRYRVDDRVWRYAKAGASLNPQKGSFDQTEWFAENTVKASSIGDMYVEITTDSTSGNVTNAFGVANNMVGGYLSQPDGTNSQFRRIVGHDKGASGATIKVYLDGPLTRDMLTNTFCEWQPNPYLNLKQSNGNRRAAMGVPTTVIASGSYGWVQTWGPKWVAQFAGADFGGNYDQMATWTEGGNITDADNNTNSQIAGFIMGIRLFGDWQNPPFIFLTISP
ncbi:hypothetical protein LCGC14_1939670 [marine sediment metagenome]|uniref:Uncharacterized protein n=1 Tax=marine sediment metagenome TaxID=412755 RepID=A0A0F9FKM2_9ZZZZ